MKVTVKTIGPTEAKRMLAKLHPNQRKTSDIHVAHLSHLMANRQFVPSTDSIGFDTDGLLVNGQHRLEAIIRSNTAHEFVVVSGLSDRSIFEAIDQNKTRSVSDIASMNRIPNSQQATACIRDVMAYDLGYTIQNNTSGTNKRNACYIRGVDVVAFYNANSDLVSQAIVAARKIGIQSQSRPKLFNGMRTASAAYYICARVNSATPAFFDSLADGEDLRQGSAVLSLREVLLANMTAVRKFPAKCLMAFTIRAFNAFAQGKPISRVALARWTANDSIPLPTGIWKGGKNLADSQPHRFYHMEQIEGEGAEND